MSAYQGKREWRNRNSDRREIAERVRGGAFAQVRGGGDVVSAAAYLTLAMIILQGVRSRGVGLERRNSFHRCLRPGHRGEKRQLQFERGSPD